jgi:copper(I)-binding protein
MPLPAAAGGIAVALLGAAGLVRGAVPEGPAASAPIVVSNAYARAPAPPTDAMAAYFTVVNTTARPDRLVSVVSSAGETSVLHTGSMRPDPAGVLIPAHGRLVLSTGKGHVMIQRLIGTVRPGQTVRLDLSFQHAGVVPVAAKVIAVGAPVPSGGR